MTEHTMHPLVDAYLRDLDGLLAGLGAGERAEVLAGVREHIDDALRGSAQPGVREVHTVLAELGPPEAVADEAYAGLPAPGTTSPPQGGALEQPWVLVVVLVLLALALVVTTFMTGSLGGYGTSGTASVTADGRVIEEHTTISFDIGFPVAIVLALLNSAILRLPATVLVWISPLWTRREQVHLSLLTPAAAALVTVLPRLGWLLTHTETGINTGAWIGLALGLAGGFWLLWRHTRVARQRAVA